MLMDDDGAKVLYAVGNPEGVGNADVQFAGHLGRGVFDVQVPPRRRDISAEGERIEDQGHQDERRFSHWIPAIRTILQSAVLRTGRKAVSLSSDYLGKSS